GNEHTILRTRPARISAARPTSPFPALLLITVRLVAPDPTSASMSSTGWAAGPNPPINTRAPPGPPPADHPRGAVRDPRHRLGGSSGDADHGSATQVLDDHGEPLPDTDADPGHPPPLAAGPQGAGERAEPPGPGGAQRVADGDG